MDRLADRRNGAGAPAAPTVAPPADTVALDALFRESNVGETLDCLDRELVGLAPVKRRIREIAAFLLVSRAREQIGLSTGAPGLHMCFTGNPGTGKTTVAMRMAALLHGMGYLRKGHLVSVTRDDLVGQYIGHTATKTKEVLKKAMGGVLFIDEAYYLYRPENERDYGQEAIEILLQVMENQRDDVVVILAGYKDRMETSSDIDVNMSVGSIFSILRASSPGVDAVAADFLQPGTSQVCAGYAIYGPSTMLVLTVGTGVHAFTLDPLLGEFILTHPDLAIPRVTSDFTINASASRFWEPTVKRYVDECLAGRTGPRGRDFTMRWIASLVAETHHILLRGGVFLCPRDARDPVQRGQPHLLYKANPIAFIVEQAGGRASNGRDRVLEITPQTLHQRVGFIFGSRDEVERVEEYHRDHNVREFEAPLFALRGLFRAVG